MSELRVYVAQDSVGAAGENTWTAAKGNRMGALVVIDFFTQMALEGRAFQVRIGTVATGLAADSTLTDTASQMCVDAPLGTTIIPAELGVSIVSIATALLLSVKLKSVGAASTAGTGFV